VATLKLALFGTPRDELSATVDGEVPEWIERIYESFNTTAAHAPASASVLALAESLGHRLRKLSLLLAKMESLGWWVEPDKWYLIAHTDLDELAAQEQLEDAGVWIIAHEMAPLDKEGNVRWVRGIFS
jgi:hypothetical protein